jgi:hypothetical protein
LGRERTKGRKLLRTLDRIWFKLKDLSMGYNSGYIDGFRAAQEVTEAQTLRRLKDKDPGLKDKSFQLGYAHAVEVVKGNIK